MGVYTLVITGADGHQHTTLSEFPTDAAAIGDVRGVITEEHPTIAIARGAGEEAVFLGVWDWRPEGPRFTEDDA